ncbi:hypothetical protein EC575_18445 [Vibrio cholerae]|uniref:hypothetical protein n=1 Tax=Vibrio cholerae TaxID=666 RepID=UPI000F41D170|nr:hypothetical protein [Vibrio cholerae]MCU8350997.1 hypothetical protein [Vibrio vulnificus]HBC3984581.1 hypothetical protein [Vibrio parahaemolyticus]EGQ8121717.1 hypothetical protein [Vibrio cholerae]ELL3753101.1 hypothetical protein [Vibrio cholerae]RND30687.1 hypothetical protein EC575_18445 [Vibrio cholerae]
MCTKKTAYEKEFVEGTVPYATHSDELADIAFKEFGFDIYESNCNAAMKRIETLCDVVKPSTAEDDELERLTTLVDC